MRSNFLHLLLCLLGFALACSSEDPASPGDHPVTTPPVWTELQGFPPARTLYALWLPREGYAIAVGPRGTVMRWDGLQWAEIDNESTRNLFAVTGMIGGETVAAGDGGEIVRFAGSRFAIVASPTTEDLRGLWTPGGNTFTAVGSGGVILRGDGSTWTLDASPVSTPLFAVWGSAADDIFAVGLNGVIVHYDGNAWTAMASGTSALLTAVNGNGPDDVYAAGEAGTILHYDGTGWTSMPTDTRELLQGICAGESPTAVGSNGVLASLANGTWTTSTLTGEWLYAVAWNGARTWAVGSRAIFMNDGTGWNPETRGAVPRLNDVVGPPRSALRVVGDLGYVVRESGDAWEWEESGDARELTAAWVAPDGDVFAVGRNRIVRHDGIAWTTEYSSPVDLRDVSGGPSGLYTVGTNATIMRRDGDGAWRTVRPTEPVYENLHAYVSVEANQAFILGDNGRILSYTGAAWVVSRARAPATMYAAAPGLNSAVPVVAVGARGAIAGISRTAAWPMDSPTTSDLFAIAPGPDGKLYAAGQGGVLIVYDGVSRWKAASKPTLKTLRSAWFDGESLFLVGGEATSGPVLLRYGPP